MEMLERQPCLFPGAVLRPSINNRPAWPFGELEPWSFDLIMADPPWRFRLRSRQGEGKSAQAHYACMSLTDIKALPVSDLAREDCLLWLWGTAPMTPQALDVMSAWGFRFVTIGAWHKKTIHGATAFGTGYRLRSAMEPFFIGARGKPKSSRSVRNLVEGLAREHSRKPDEAFAAAVRLMPHAHRVELFSRETRPGWSAWGNEPGLFDGAAVPTTAFQIAKHAPKNGEPA